eukprot:gene7313-7383_t
MECAALSVTLASVDRKPDVSAFAQAVLCSDQSHCVDQLDQNGDVSLLAEALAHQATAGPLMLGIIGSSGSGKSTFLNLLSDRITGLTRAADTNSGPFLGRIISVKLTAAAGPDPVTALAGTVYQALEQVSGDYAAVLDEAQHVGQDASDLAREALSEVGEARVQLDAERQNLQDLTGRSARLSETLLFATPGSRVDAYIRRLRSRMEPRLRAFGFASAEPVLAFKTLVRDVAEAPGVLPRFGAFCRSLWAFQGQARLLIWAALSVMLALLAAFVLQTQAQWTAALKSAPESLQPALAAMIAHIDVLKPLQAVLLGLALVLVGYNVWRAIKFFMPISHAVALLRSESVGRRRELDGLIAHQAQRVQSLSEEVEQAVQRADLASARARGQKIARKANVPAFLQQNISSGRHFLQALGDIILGKHVLAPRIHEAETSSIPKRIIVFIDGLERLSASERAQFIGPLTEALNHPAFLTVLALEDDQSLSRSALARLVQIPYQMNKRIDAVTRQKLVHSLLQPMSKLDDTAAARYGSALDRPFTAAEMSLLQDFAGETDLGPRELKRLVNLYRLIRCIEPNSPAEALLALLVEYGFSAADRDVFDRKLDQINSHDFDGASGRIIALSRAAVSGSLSLEALRKGRELARRVTQQKIRPAFGIIRVWLDKGGEGCEITRKSGRNYGRLSGGGDGSHCCSQELGVLLATSTSGHVAPQPAAGDPSRRDFLFIATGAVGAVGLGGVVWPFISQMNPDASTLALASIEVDIGGIAEGQIVTIKWRGNPVFIRHRTKKEIEEVRALPVSKQIDPQKDEERVKPGKEQWLIVLGSCTHLGCVPLGHQGDYDGWSCPCHGSQYDASGRVTKGPAPLNLPVPAYEFVSDTKVKIG